jgi:serine/threonine protein kinase/Flp pilus assembly protein TadD
MTVVDPQKQEIGVCAMCGKSITHPGPDGECMRCLVSFGFLAEDQERAGANDRVVPAPLRYAHFEVELNTDGFPLVLGSGAMAVTYRARDTVLNSTVALKVISQKLAENPSARARFLREARAAAQIRHPNVARVTHYGEQNGECFYAMQFVDGETLEARVQRGGPLPLALALEVIEQAARGLAAGEACGVIHRDLKPSNLMIESDPSGHLIVKIIDYGVAKVMAGDGTVQTQSGFIGTPAFASPEQFEETRKQQIDNRSDIYSLGTTFWYLLTGRMPFASRSIEEVRARQEKQLPLEQLRYAHVPARVIALLKSMLAVEPAKRPQTALGLLSAIHRCHRKFSIEARSRRKRSIILAGGTILILGAAGFGTWLHQRERSSAEIERSIAVLPFENRSEDKANAFFTDGVQDEILTDLAKIADLKVISRTSVMQYESGVARNLRDIAQQLGVANVVQGSVQRSGNRVRVNAQLIDARNDAQLWAQTYDRDLDDVFAIQSEIAKAIADQLQAKLSPAERSAIEERPTADVAAFDRYSRGKTLLLAKGVGAGVEVKLREGVNLLKSATDQDPNFHAAFCEIVYGSDLLYAEGYDHTPERLAVAEAALRRAEQLKPNSPETHLARANHLYYALRDHEGAQAELDIAARGLPNDSRIPELNGYIVRRKGKDEEALPLLKQAITLDPRNTVLLEQIAASQLRLRQYADAKETYNRALQIKPDDILFRIFRSETDWYWHADPDPACRTVQEVRLSTPDSVADVADNWFSCALSKRDWAAAEQALAALGDNPCWAEQSIQFSRQFGEGLLARAMHDDARARRAFSAARVEQEQLVQKQKDYGPPLCVLGLIDAALGNKEAALQEGRRAMELMPREKDAINGEMLMTYFAVIAAWSGEKDLALQQLNAAISLKTSPLIISYGMLKLSPFWDPLRGDPRFENIVGSFAPN